MAILHMHKNGNLAVINQECVNCKAIYEGISSKLQELQGYNKLFLHHHHLHAALTCSINAL